MARVALVSHDVQAVQGRAGGVGAFVTHWARLLKAHGEDVTIIFVHQDLQSPAIDARWAANYQAWGIGFVDLHSDQQTPERWPEAWAVRLSEKLHPLLADYDIVYFQDWANSAFHTVRAKRFSAERQPVCVTVLHGPSTWVRRGNRSYPKLPDDLHLEYVERYAAEHSDYVLAPSRYLLDWLQAEDWRFRNPPAVLRLPFLPDATPGGTGLVSAPRTKVIFFGRLETRKGFRLFAGGILSMLASHPEISVTLEEIVLLGHEDEAGSVVSLSRQLQRTGLTVTHLGHFDSRQAGGYLAENAAHSVVVIASAFENFPYAVIEASLIPGIELICSRGGGIPEVLGDPNDSRLFEPYPQALAQRLYQALTQPQTEAKPYEFASANQAWLDFHSSVTLPQARPQAPAELPSVCVCIPFFNKARYFEQTLDALAIQTCRDFTVVVMDDGSTDSAALDVFQRMKAKYGPRGWQFLQQENAFVDAARNAAAAQGNSTYLLFLDADDLLPPHALERMLQAAVLSGVDCLVSGSLLFSGDEPPFPTVAHYMPLGMNLVAGLIEPVIFGGPMILVRRSAFEAIGGYRAVRGAAHEDWELQARLVMAGFDSDVLPEYLHHYRQLPDGLAKTSDGFLAKRRIIDCYEEQFSRIGMHGMGGLVYALYRRCQELEGAVREDVPLELRMRLHERLTKMLGKSQ